MLVLTRKSEESIIVGSAIEVKVLDIRGDQVSLGFIAPKEICIHRKEVYEAIQEENRRAAAGNRSDAHKLLSSFGRQLFKTPS